MSEGHFSKPPSKGTLLWQILGACIIASLIMVFFVLPVEFHRDPTGFGQLTGLDDLAGPQTVAISDAPEGSGTTARYYDIPLRNDTFEIALPPEGFPGSELEYKVEMKTGETLTYSWNVTGDEQNPDWFYSDFHGESRPAPPAKGVVMEYRQAVGITSRGAFVAPLDGVHGWYFQNQSDKPVVVHLRLAGFYRLVPPGEYGNDMKILPLSQNSQ